MKKIYLAGPDVFRPDAPAWGLSLKALCREFGFDGLFPLDNAAPEDLSGAALATWIYQANPDLFLAGILGALMSVVFNYSVTRVFTWR